MAAKGAGGTEGQGLPSVWTRTDRRRREQPALSRDQIVTEAVRLLDEEGLEALSMRKLGTRLNAGATSLYTHVSNKDELIELVVDAIFAEAEVPVLAEGGDWRAALTACAQSLRTVIVRHPWTASVFGQVGLSYLGPNMMQVFEDMLALFETAGFTLEEGDYASSTVYSFVLGMATSEAAWLSLVARSGKSEQEWVEQLLPAAERAVQSYPRYKQRFEAQKDAAADGVRGDKFLDGLDCLMDGLEVRRGRRGK
ncbi:TetR/AcrR family transcriptional regulator C-terminal domain-containing protein [Streptomyces sp. NPDC050095]|uniref:TetR/AcrR family transcriptional regulator C-terminal domain-containing protein n=1 Tax=unclassified Streptomyces TaxID=2593676 RepID=UPI00341251C6